MTSPNNPRRRGSQAITSDTARRQAFEVSHEFSGGLDLASIEAAAEALLADVGIACQLPPESATKCAAAGVLVSAGRVRFPIPLVMDLMASAPERFTHAATNDKQSIEVSTSMAVFGPALVASHLWVGQSRRPVTAADAAFFAAVAGDAGLDYGATSIGLLTSDVNPNARMEIFLGSSARPLIVPARMPVHTRDLIAGARAGSSCRLAVLAPVESALTLDEAFAEALVETAATKQCLIVAPTLLIGANAPATLEGALVRFAAEAMAGVAIAQALCPGQPVAVGATVAEVSMRNGLPLPGTADSFGVLGAAIALARRWNVAFYACGPATNAKGFNALGAAETSRWLTAAHYLGANAVIGAIGAVDLDNGVSVEKLIVDAEVVAGLGRMRSRTTDDACAELRALGPGGTFLATAEARAMAHRQSMPRIAGNALFESWAAEGSPTVDQTIAAIIAQTAVPTVNPSSANANIAMLARRPTHLADLAAEIYSRSMRDAFGFKG